MVCRLDLSSKGLRGSEALTHPKPKTLSEFWFSRPGTSLHWKGQSNTRSLTLGCSCDNTWVLRPQHDGRNWAVPGHEANMPRSEGSRSSAVRTVPAHGAVSKSRPPALVRKDAAAGPSAAAADSRLHDSKQDPHHLATACDRKRSHWTWAGPAVREKNSWGFSWSGGAAALPQSGGSTSRRPEAQDGWQLHCLRVWLWAKPLGVSSWRLWRWC